jgi:hypothetical protein
VLTKLVFTQVQTVTPVVLVPAAACIEIPPVTTEAARPINTEYRPAGKLQPMPIMPPLGQHVSTPKEGR